MPQFIITYLGGDHPKTPEEGQAHFAKYKQWLTELGNKVVSPANPLKGTTVVKPDGSTSIGSQSGMSGYTVLEMESLEEAIEAAKSCPFLEINGSLEVSERVDMPM